MDGRISNYLGHVEECLEALEETNTQQAQLIKNLIESHERLRFCHNFKSCGLPMGHVRSALGEGTSEGEEYPVPENIAALPVPMPRRGIQPGGHHGRAMQERACRCRDRRHRSRGESPLSSSSSKENHSPPFVSAPASSSLLLGLHWGQRGT